MKVGVMSAFVRFGSVYLNTRHIVSFTAYAEKNIVGDKTRHTLEISTNGSFKNLHEFHFRTKDEMDIMVGRLLSAATKPTPVIQR